MLNKNYKIIPLSGYSKSKILYCNENGYYSLYESDRYGFNNPDQVWDSGKIDFLFIGDSYVQGACVNRPDDVVSVVRNLSKKNVIGLGTSGLGPLSYFALMREYLNPKVKNIFWIHYEGNDFFDLENELKDKILLKYYENNDFSQNLKFRLDEIDSLWIKYSKETLSKRIKNNYYLNFRKFLKLSKTRQIFLNYFPETFHPKIERSDIFKNKKFREFSRILKLAKDFSKKNNSKLYFVYVPEYHHFKSYFQDNDYQQVKKIVQKLNLPFIDIAKEIKNINNPLSVFPNERFGHFNEKGYKFFGETIYKFTQD